MAEIVAALDEVGANKLLQDAIAAFNPSPDSGTDSLDVFQVDWTVSVSLSGGSVDLIPSDTIRIEDLHLDFSVDLTFHLNLNDIGEICIPESVSWAPWGFIYTPEVCFDLPNITFDPVSHSGWAEFTGDFHPQVTLIGGTWKIDAVLDGIPSLKIDPATVFEIQSLLLAVAVSALFLAGPFGWVFVPVVVTLINTLGAAALTGFLGPLLTPFVSGLALTVYQQPQLFEVVPAAGPVDPAVHVTLDSVSVSIDGSGGEDELVIGVDISP
jgi:hypothetical protein